MRPLSFLSGSLAAVLVLALAPLALAAAAPSSTRGLWLVTNYPAITARAGETTTLSLKVENADLPPERVELAVDDVPAGWKAVFLGGGSPVEAAMPATNNSVPLQLRLDIPAGAAAGTHRLLLHATGADVKSDLPVAITIGADLPAKLEIKPQLPSLSGDPTTSFDYQFSVKNDSDKDLVVKLGAAAPEGFRTDFTESYGSQKISSIPVGAGKSRDLKISVHPRDDVPAGDYPVRVRASAEQAVAETQLTMHITGEPKLALTGDQGRLSADAEAGNETPISLVLRNTGTAPANDIDLSASPPEDWKISFQPKKVEVLGPGQKRSVEALLTPSAKAIAGDYMTTMTASSEGASSSADFRITVSTSTLWGVVGIGIIAASLLVAVGAVARYGRR
ncbi:MAG TPA: NEW3 domain-containing protein [Stellaceae bacterium]|nr:NEW3 domain-containing protein [Stellaceae bacterium]